MATCAFCQIDLGSESQFTLVVDGQARGGACMDLLACRLRVALGGLHEWSRPERDAIRRISDVLSVLPQDERRGALDQMVRILVEG